MENISQRNVIASNLLVAALLFSACLHPAFAKAEELGFALIGTEASDTLVSMWEPLLEDMSRRTGIAIKARAFSDYSGAVWALKTNKAQLAWLGNKSAIRAVDEAQSEVAFICVEEGGETGYTAQLIVAADSPFKSWEDVMKNASSITFALGDPNSTSGFTIPSYYLFAANQIDPNKAFMRLIHGSHEENFLSVVQGRAEAATNNSFDLKRMRAKYPEKFPLIRVIWNSPLIPSDPIVWRKDLPENQKTAIRLFLLQYGQPSPGKDKKLLAHEQAVLKGLGRSAFRVSDDSQLLMTRRLDLFTLKEKTMADPTLNEEARKEKIKEIDQRLNALQTYEKSQPQ